MAVFTKIGLASDHAGKELKSFILEFLKVSGVETIDFGMSSLESKTVDYPDYAKILAEHIVSGRIQAGIAICGTGLGMAISANKFPGIRAACVWDEYSCRMSRSHNDINMLCLGGRTLNPHRAADLVKLWMETSFEGDRHQHRLEKIKEIEKKNFRIKDSK